MSDPNIDRLVGNNGYIRISDDFGDRVKIPFVSWIATTTTGFADRTSTRNYSREARVMFRSGVPVIQSLTAEIKGRYRKSITPASVIAQLFRGNVPFRVELGFSPLYPYVDTYAWIENLEMTVGSEDIVNFSCSIRSEGEITDLTNQAHPDDPDEEEDF